MNPRNLAIAGVAVLLVGAGLAVVAQDGVRLPWQGSCAYPSEAWHQPGLYAEANTTEADGWALTRENPSGLAFENETLDQRFGADGYALAEVSLKHPSSASSAADGHLVRLDAEGQVTILAGPEPDADAVSSTFRAFAANVTSADEATIDDWEESLLASETPSEYWGADESDPGGLQGTAFRVTVTQLTLSEQFRQLSPSLPDPVPAEEEITEHDVGNQRVSHDAWGYEFAFPTVHLENEDGDAPAVTEIGVDARDVVAVEAELEDPDSGSRELVDLVGSTFEDLGWSEPDLDAGDVRVIQLC